MTSNQEDQIISEFLESIGPWRDYVVIGGGFALFIYKLYLSDPKLKNFPVGTRDIDSLIPRKIPEVSKKNIQSTQETMKQKQRSHSKKNLFIKRDSKYHGTEKYYVGKVSWYSG